MGSFRASPELPLLVNVVLAAHCTHRAAAPRSHSRLSRFADLIVTPLRYDDRVYRSIELWATGGTDESPLGAALRDFSFRSATR